MSEWTAGGLHARNEWREGLSYEEYAGRWVDMVPHLATLTALAGHAATIVEFGIRGGVSTWAFLRGLSGDGRLIGYDTDPNVPNLLPPDVAGDPRFELRLADTTQAPMPEHADLVMIDSSHAYEATVIELRRAAEMEPALIVLHDYNDPPHPGVRQAIDEFLAASSTYVLERVEASQWGLAILARR